MEAEGDFSLLFDIKSDCDIDDFWVINGDDHIAIPSVESTLLKHAIESRMGGFGKVTNIRVITDPSRLRLTRSELQKKRTRRVLSEARKQKGIREDPELLKKRLNLAIALEDPLSPQQRARQQSWRKKNILEFIHDQMPAVYSTAHAAVELEAAALIADMNKNFAAELKTAREETLADQKLLNDAKKEEEGAAGNATAADRVIVVD